MSRFDDIGFFWQDLPRGRGAGGVARVMPDIPDTGWVMPKEFPNLKAAPVISLDTETYDPELMERGPGWARGVGHIVGVSIGVPGHNWYFPMRHEIEPENNLEPEKVLSWLQDTLSSAIPKVGANLTYDLGWLRQEGIIVGGPLVDIQFAEALLNESSKIALDVMAHKYLNAGKETSLLYQWCADYYGGMPGQKQRANIYRAPARLVGPYAESDADLPLRLAKILFPLLEHEGLLDLFDMECRLIRLILDMRFQGVRVNVQEAEKVRSKLLAQEKTFAAKLRDLVGFEVNVNASQSLAQAFDKLGLKYKRTKPTTSFPEGNPSFTKTFIKSVTHPVGDLIRTIRTSHKMRTTFIEGYILDSNINGVVYGSFHQMRGEGGGTRSGRFSSSHPNLQNVPSRDKWAPIIRGIFIPFDWQTQWRKYDYSQIEYRLLVHFALGIGADEVRQRYILDPNLDYHALTQALVKERTGIKLARKPAKSINFGLIYGMGVPTLAAQLGLPVTEAKKLFGAYHKGAPFVKTTMDHYMKKAQQTGIIKTILGRKSRFDLWEPEKWGENTVALPYRAAMAKYGRIRRAYTHKSLNRLLQGSAADIMKAAMLKCYESGIFDETGIPVLTVHDELDFGDPGGKDEAFEEMRRMMEQAIPLKIPVLCDAEIGPDWGHVE